MYDHLSKKKTHTTETVFLKLEQKYYNYNHQSLSHFSQMKQDHVYVVIANISKSIHTIKKKLIIMKKINLNEISFSKRPHI